MAFFLVTGKLGSGKSLITVAKMQEYLISNRAVATNLDINTHLLVNPWAKKCRVTRMPDKPTLNDFKNLPVPYEGDYNEEKTGLIVLDECGTWFNSRNYRDKERGSVIDELLHIRKRGWDVMLIVQHINMIDSQVREGMGEQVVYCSRFDKISIPLISPILKALSLPYKAPKLHQALVKYGTSAQAPTIERWVHFGTNLYDAYDTRQVFGANDCAMSTVLPPYYYYGRYIGKFQHVKRQTINSINKSRNAIHKAKWFFFALGIVSTLLIKSFFFSSPDGQQLTVNVQEVETQPEQEKSLLNNVYIGGSVYSTHGYSYAFVDKNDNIVEPENEGFTVLGLKPCIARLVKNNELTIVRCKGMGVAGEPQRPDPETI